MIKKIYFLCMMFLSCATMADTSRLLDAYPEMIQDVTDDVVIWHDGTSIPLSDGIIDKSPQEKLDTPALIDQLAARYIAGFEGGQFLPPQDDPGRVRYEPFFKKMYGDTEAAVKANLVTIYWMPKIFGSQYPLQVTMVNHLHEKFMDISNELESLVFLHPEYQPFLNDPGGTFSWRYIANTNRLSNHSFGMTIDINSKLSNYWQWDLLDKGEDVSETIPLVYRNTVPLEIVSLFEKYGFIWGGKWYHYDSMHFEYRPEIFTSGLRI